MPMSMVYLNHATPYQAFPWAASELQGHTCLCFCGVRIKGACLAFPWGAGGLQSRP